MSTPESDPSRAQLSPVEFDPFAESELEAVLPMTRPQTEMWMTAQQSDDASCAFNLSLTFHLEGELDVGALHNALRQLCARHQSLRASFVDDSMTLCIARSREVVLPLEDLSAQSAEDRARALLELQRAEVSTPFDLRFGPLLRTHLVKFSEHSHKLLFTFHHLVADGWSLDLMTDELAELYSALVEGRASRLPPAYPFVQYWAWLNEQEDSPARAATEQFWLSRFREPVPSQNLPVDHPHQPTRSFRSQRTDIALDAQTAKRVHQAAAELGSTFFMFTYAAFCAFLHRLTGQQDLVVGVPAAGHTILGETHLVGHCVNTLPMRLHPGPTVSFRQFLAEVRELTYASFEHRQFTYSDLLGQISVSRESGRPPLVSTIFNVDQENHTLAFSGLQAHYTLNPRTHENFEWSFNLVAQKGALEVQCQYNADLFDEASMRLRLQEFVTFLQGVIAQPDQPLGEIPLLPQVEREMLQRWNATAREYAGPATVHGLFEQQVDATPDAVALAYGSDTLSYTQLDARANRLAHYLIAAGVQPGELIGVCMERSFEMLVALLAVMKAGAAYAPLDPDYPEERLRFMIEDTGAKIVLAHQPTHGAVPRGQARIVLLDSERSAIEAQSPSRPGLTVQTTDLAYVIYTSGSTGKPKGVANEHRGICNHLHWMKEVFDLQPHDVVLKKTPFSFDVSVWEMFWPLTTGARLAIAPPRAHQDPEAIVQLIAQHGVTTIHFVPSMLSVFLGYLETAPASVRQVMSSGEAVTAELHAQLLQKMPKVRYHNLYGPTETAVHVSHWEGERTGWRVAPIGRPFSNTQLHVVDARGKPQPIGVAGELCIGGVHVARGYLNRPELNAKLFVPDPFADAQPAVMYRSGDLARWNTEGVVEFLGRIDSQVKVRGLRIELGEIESVLAQYEAVEKAAAIVFEPTAGDARLVAYYVSGRPLGEDQLRAHLAAKLPAYMVPQILLHLESLPLTASGKTDYKNLPRPTLEIEPTVELGQAPRSAAEKRIAAMWRELIGVAEVGRADRFFDLGGHSLLAMRFVLQVRKEFGVRLTLNSVLMESLEVIARQCSGDADVAQNPQAPETANPVSLMDTFFFGDEQLYGVLRTPLSSPKAERAVLICAPHGQESMRAQRLITTLMTGLAEAGVASMRFDYFGTGDSEGLDSEATLARWRQDIVEACRELQQRSGAEEIIPVGIRIGASLLDVLAREKRVKRCILWDPIASGHLELQALRALHHDVLHDHGRFLWRLPPKAAGNGEELASFHYSTSLMAELAALTLQPADFAGLASVQVLSSKQEPLLERFCQQLNVRGTRCELVAVNSDGDWSDFARLAHSLNRQEPIKKMLSTLLQQA